MLKNIKNIFYLITFFAFISSVLMFYFSDANKKKTNQSRSFYSVSIKEKKLSIPLLKSDTNDVIEYRDDLEIYKKSKKKYFFWDLIKK
tara:strand:- start:8962 stop:9225 length:264 start_codon:yes stop_codon:yes gene_type:complete